MNEQTQKDINDMLDKSSKVFEILVDDRKTLMQHILKGKNKQFWCRTYLRYVFADLEARAYQLRQMILICHHAGVTPLLPEEVMFLEETVFRVDDKGDLIASRAKIRTSSNLLFTFKMFAKLSTSDASINTGLMEWAEFRSTIAIRDRITHPRTVDDLTISNDEITMAIRVMEWVDRLFAGLRGQFDYIYKRLDELGYVDEPADVG